MWIPMPQRTCKSSDERTVTARAQEALELYQEIIEAIKFEGRVPMRSDVLLSARRLDPKEVDLFPVHVSSDEMDPKDFRDFFHLR